MDVDNGSNHKNHQLVDNEINKQINETEHDTNDNEPRK